ncbi:DHH family phosphoesterase [Sporosalibacterium faouarense]|uniref:DHH family phosphoesterase n=1 Tax=Sporosalibacterium faouarense TaxID=516123 RepID=UPI00192A7D3F|nr:bifunctional oligoribonuclease/PAP phosphatase NrnA [Sporosalibacterium faouarense]
MSQMKMKNNSFNDIKEKINSSEKICLIAHVNPDGDSIGSLLGLGLALKKDKDKVVKIALNDELPKNFKFLPGTEYLESTKEEESFDLLITLDCSDLNRLGKGKYIANNADYIINIDHHISNDYFGDMNIVFPNFSSTGEIVFTLAEAIDLDIDKNIATCLYVAISTDTGSFKYDSTSPDTFRVASELLKKEINLNEITRNVYQSRSLERTNLLIKSLNSMELYENNRLAMASVTRDMIDDCNASIQDIDGTIDFIRDIDGVEVACILKEYGQEEIKVGFRSKSDVDVANVAEKFGGGGHRKASGCTIYDKIDKAREMILEEIKKALR